MLRKSLAFLLAGILMVHAPAMVLAETSPVIQNAQEDDFSMEESVQTEEEGAEEGENALTQEDVFQESEAETEEVQEAEISQEEVLADSEEFSAEEEAAIDILEDKDENHSVETAIPVEFGRNYQGVLIEEDEKDWYSFTLEQDVKVRITAEGDVPNISYTLKTRAEVGFTIRWEASPSIADETGKIRTTGEVLLPSGTYYFTVSNELYNYPDQAIGNYQFMLETLESWEDPDDNHTGETAVPIELGREYQGLFSAAREEDWYRFTVDKPMRVRIYGEDRMSRNITYYLKMKTENGYEVKWSQTTRKKNGEEKNTCTEEILLLPATYYFVVQNTVINTGSYEFIIEFLEDWEDGNDNHKPETAVPVRLGEKCQGSLTEKPEEDWYCFTLEEPSQARITTSAKMPFISYGLKKQTTDGYEEIWEIKSLKADNTGFSVYTQSLDLESGTYYFTASNAPDQSSGMYEFTINTLENTENHSWSTAYPIELGQEYRGRLSKNWEEDWYSFTISKRTPIKITAEAQMPYISYGLKTKAEDGFYLKWYKNSVEADETGKSTYTGALILEPDTYYFTAANSPEQAKGNYRFTIEELEEDSNLSPDTAKEIKPGETYECSFLTQDENRWYSMSFDKYTMAKITIESSVASVGIQMKNVYSGGSYSIVYPRELLKADSSGKVKRTISLPLGARNIYYLILDSQDLSELGSCKFTVETSRYGREISLGETKREQFREAGEIVSYELTVPDSGVLNLQMNPQWGKTGYRIRERESDRYLWEGSAGGGLGDTAQINVLSGRYILEVVNESPDPKGTYEFSVSFKEEAYEGIVKLEQVQAIDARSIEVSWKEVPQASGYRVYRKVPGGNWKTLANNIPGNSYTDNNAVPGQIYYYTVKAYCYGELSERYETSQAVSTEVTVPKLTGVKQKGYDSLVFHWEEVPGADFYYVYKKEPGGKWQLLGTVEENSYTDRTAAQNTAYIYTTRAAVTVDHTLYRSEFDTKGVSGKRVLAIPEIREVKAVGARNIRLSWNALEGVSQYRLYRAVPGGKWQMLSDKVKGTSYTDNNAAPGQKYCYTIKAYYGQELTSTFKTSEIAATQIEIPELSGVKQNGYASLVFHWEEVPGADFYYVYKKEPGGKWQLLGTVEENSYTDRAAAQNTAYIYTTRAAVTVDHTLYRSEFDTKGVSGKRVLAIPEIREVKAVGARNIRLSWNALEGVSQYRLYRAVPGGKWQILSDKVKGTSYTDNNAVPGQEYYYTIKAYYGQELTTAFKTSNKAVAQIERPGLMGTKVQNGTKIRFEWEEKAGADGYYVYRKEPGSKWQLLDIIPDNTYLDGNVKKGGTYIYTVRAYVKVAGEIYRSDFDERGLTQKVE